MSHYLIEQIAALPNVEVRTRQHRPSRPTARTGGCARLRVRGGPTASETELDADACFVFIGASPRTDWLDGVVARDERGFILAGPDAQADGWPLKRDPYLLETSVPGVFVAGDVRARSIKRVASAVGRGLDGGLAHPRVPGRRMTSPVDARRPAAGRPVRRPRRRASSRSGRRWPRIRDVASRRGHRRAGRGAARACMLLLEGDAQTSLMDGDGARSPSAASTRPPGWARSRCSRAAPLGVRMQRRHRRAGSR